MAQDFQVHGVEIRQQQGSRLIVTLDGEKLGFVGTAPIHKADPAKASIDRLEYILSEADLKAAFGHRMRGYSIPEVWNVAKGYGVGELFFVNVFDPATHTGTSAQHHTIDSGVADLGELLEHSAIEVYASEPVPGATWNWLDGAIDTGETHLADVVVMNAAQTVTYREGADYTIDGGTISVTGNGAIDTGEDAWLAYARPTGAAKVLGTDYAIADTDGIDPDTGEPFAGGYSVKAVSLSSITIAEGESIFVIYQHADPKFVPDSAFVGGMSIHDEPSGLEHFRFVRSQQGFDVTQLFSERSESPAIASALEAMANKLRCRCHINISQYATTSNAIAGRANNTGLVGNAFTQDDVVSLYTEHFFMPFPDGGSILVPQAWHGAIARYAATRDYNFGRSISSLPIEGVIVPFATRSLSRSDTSADNQRLSEQGSFVTAYREFGSGWVFDGSKNAAFPTVNDGSHFGCVRNQRDTVLRSAERFVNGHLDQPLTQVLALSLASKIDAWIESLTNPNRAGGQVLAAPAAGQEKIVYCTIDVPENDGTARAQGILWMLLNVPYLTPFNTCIIAEKFSFTGFAAA